MAGFSIIRANDYFVTSEPGLAKAAQRQGAEVVGTHVFRVRPRLGSWLNMPAAIEIRGKDLHGDDVKWQVQRFRYVGGGVWEVAAK